MLCQARWVCDRRDGCCAGLTGAVTGQTDAVTGETDAVTGETDAVTGETDAVTRPDGCCDRSAALRKKGLHTAISGRDLAGEQGRVVAVAQIRPEQVQVERARRIGARASRQGRHRGRVTGCRAADETPRRPAVEHEPI